jgi:hypothetical protein
MEYSGSQQAITRLLIEHADLMREYAECTKRDERFEVKRSILKRMREIEQEIKNLGIHDSAVQKLFGKY